MRGGVGRVFWVVSDSKELSLAISHPSLQSFSKKNEGDKGAVEEEIKIRRERGGEVVNG